jgi:hypothetical protein
MGVDSIEASNIRPLTPAGLSAETPADRGDILMGLLRAGGALWGTIAVIAPPEATGAAVASGALTEEITAEALVVVVTLEPIQAAEALGALEAPVEEVRVEVTGEATVVTVKLKE